VRYKLFVRIEKIFEELKKSMVKFSAKLEYIYSAMKGLNFRTVWGIAWYWNEKPTISEPVGYQTKLTQSSIFCPALG
jgi:hypothetical protein